MYQTFGTTLYQEMQSRRISMAKLSDALGEKSKTAVARIIADNCSQHKREAVLQQLEEQQFFDAEAFDRLQNSLEVSRLGIDDYKAMLGVKHLIALDLAKRPTMRLDDGATLAAALNRFANAKALEVMLVNAHFESVAAALEPLMKHFGDDIRVRQIFNLNDPTESASLVVGSIGGMMFDMRHELYSVSVEENGSFAQYFRGDLLLLRAEYERSDRFAAFVLRDEEHACRLADATGADLFAFFARAQKAITPPMQQMKFAFEAQNEMMHVMQYLEARERWESARTIYSVKPCFGTELVPASLMVQGFAADIAACRDPRVHARVKTLMELRERNIANKREMTHLVVTKQGMRDMMRTGLVAGHPEQMPPLTPSERRDMIELFLRNDPSRRHVKLHIVGDDCARIPRQMMLYDKVGVHMLRNDPVGSFSRDEVHFAFLRYPAFTEEMKRLFFQPLFEKCLSPKETEMFLKELLCS